jgi:hypothetical protein
LDRRFLIPLACYAALGLLAYFTLDGEFRIGTLLILVLFAFKTYLDVIRRKIG